jgi:coniferyl-aldehyde dehydrogenase
MSVVGTTEPRPPSSGGADTLSATLARQRQAFLQAGPPSLEERRADLAKLKAAIRAQADAIADVISADFGNRSRQESLIAEIFTLLASIRHTSKHLGRWMRPKRVSVSAELLPGRARILYQPLGVVGIISPWNYPFYLAIMPLIAALAAGNRVMLKPSELTPRTAQFIAEFLSGLFPSEQVATMLGGPDIGAAFARLPFDHLLYTGSTAVGRLVMQAAARNLRGCLKIA